MSPIDRAGPLAGTNFALGLYKKTQPGFRDEKGSKILGTSFGAKLKKQNKDGETQPSYYFYAHHGFGNPFSCIIAVKRVADDVENSSGKAKRCHSGRLIAEAKFFITKVETNISKMLEPKEANVLA